MNIDFQEILKELEFRVPIGIIDLTQESQVTELVKILRENGVVNANEYAQRARVIFGYVNEASKKAAPKKKAATKSKNDDYGDETITYKDDVGKNRTILVKTALGYGKSKKIGQRHAYQAALKYIDKKKGSTAKSEPTGKNKEPKQLGGAELVGGAEKRAAEKKADKNDKFPKFSETPPDEIYNYMGVMDESGKKILKPKKINDKQFFTELNQSRKNAFAGEKAGKGGPATTFQEEMSCLIIEITAKNPKLSREDVVKGAVKVLSKSKFAENNELSEDYLYKLGMKSSAGVELVKDMEKNPKLYDKAPKQPDGYPKSFALSTLATQNCIHFLTSKLEDSKKTGDKKAIEHYNKELEYFAELSTKATGKEGDADTVMMYQNPNGYTRFLYITNKQTHSDPKLNHTKKSRANYIISNEVEGSNIKQLISISNIAAGKTTNMNKQATNSMKEIKSDNKLKKSIESIPSDIANAVFGRDSFKPTDEYKKDALKNSLVQEYLNKNKLEATDQNIIKACISVVGENGAEQISDSSNGTPGKFLMKMGNVWKEIDAKIKSGKTYKEIESQSKGKNKLFGGKLNAKTLEEIHKNSVLSKLSEIEASRGDSMRGIQKEIVTEINQEDVKYYKNKGLKNSEILEKLKVENGPNAQTYVKTFMSGMHWSRNILGTHDGRMVSSIGNSLTKPEYYRECLATLTDFNGETNTEIGRKKLYDHLVKKIKITPGDDSVVFTNRKGETKRLGYDTWRTAGGGEKITGTDGEDLIKCLQSKEKVNK